MSRPATPGRAEPHVARSDCERIRPGRVAQPINTLTSLAFVAAAVPLWRRAVAVGDRRGRAMAVASAAAGLGSVAYHGPGGRLGKALHDGSILALAGTAVAVLTGRARDPRWEATAAVTMALAGAVHATSRTGGPLCRPDSLLQGHAVWHVLAAAAVHAAGRAGRLPHGQLRGARRRGDPRP